METYIWYHILKINYNHWNKWKKEVGFRPLFQKLICVPQNKAI